MSDTVSKNLILCYLIWSLQKLHQIGTLIILIFFFLKKFIYLFLVALSLWAAQGLSLVVASRGYSSFRCTGFSLWWLLLLQSTAVGVGFRSCGLQAWLLHDTWDPPALGIELVSPALPAFPSTVPPRKYDSHFLNEETEAFIQGCTANKQQNHDLKQFGPA